MKNLNITFLTIFLLLSVLVVSCSVEKRVHRPGYHMKFKKSLNVSSTNEKENSKVSYEETTPNYNHSKLFVSNDIPDDDQSLDYKNSEASSIVASSENFVFSQTLNSHNRKLSFTEKCDNIILKNGEEISAKVTAIEPTKIMYKKCENLDGPTYTIDKSSVLLIKYANGTKDIFNESAKVTTKELESDKIKTDSPKNTEPISIISLIMSILGLVLALFVSPPLVGLIFLVLALILGIIGVSRAKKLNLKGKGAGITGIVIGIVGIVGVLVILTLVATIL
ncbi:MAG TPA: phage holin family protein [Chitinophagaceae bacterium]|nr:phage holin family protein [Chitinophagaceae bacterium]